MDLVLYAEVCCVFGRCPMGAVKNVLYLFAVEAPLPVLDDPVYSYLRCTAVAFCCLGKLNDLFERFVGEVAWATVGFVEVLEVDS